MSFGSTLGNVLRTGAKVVGTAYDYATPGLGSSRLTDYGTNTKPAAPKTTTTKVNTPPSTFNVNSNLDSLNAQLKSAQDAYSSLLAYQQAQPKLIHYDTTAAWANATKQAQGAVDPVYADKLNQYLQQENLGKTQQTRKQQQQEQDIATALDQQLQDSGTTRTRTTQDMNTNIADTNQSETNYQGDTGTAFDRARAALLGGVANSGLTTSGIGRQQEANAITDRNTAEVQQTQKFEATRRDIHTAASRTFEDLATSDTRNQSGAATSTARSKQDLQDYIDNANLGEQGFRTQNEVERQGAISDATNAAYKTGVQQFIAGLVGSGARAQDIQLAAQIYGA